MKVGELFLLIISCNPQEIRPTTFNGQYMIEQMVEQNSREVWEKEAEADSKSLKARMVPISVCFKARKL